MKRAPFNRLSMATNLTKCAKCRESLCSCRDDEWLGGREPETVVHRQACSPLPITEAAR